MQSSVKIRNLQHSLNHFTKKYLLGVQDLIVDGRPGHLTSRHIVLAKYYLGYKGRPNRTVNAEFLHRLHHPKSKRYSTVARILRGIHRRSQQRSAWRKNHRRRPHTGVSHYDGIPVASWLVPYLAWARAHGWKGKLVSGWRDPNYSESLCYRMCGRPFCPGKCAGKSSNHSGSTDPHGAVDVSDYWNFAKIIAHCPYSPHIFNALPIDPVHFSATGR